MDVQNTLVLSQQIWHPVDRARAKQIILCQWRCPDFASGNVSCFLKCNGGESECPGGLHVYVKDSAKLDKVGIPVEAVDNGDAGDCPASMRDEAYSELRKCAVMSDVPVNFYLSLGVFRGFLFFC